jgi:gamma-glutamylcyclotransferase (GGCT)/AIG2-like uncharacterized protein YtfP
MNLFAYGTLMDEAILRAVTGLAPEAGIAARPAVLRDCARRRVRGEDYPGLIESPGEAVEGIVYLGLPEAAWGRLDRFEGDQYERRAVTVTDAEGAAHAAEVYFFRSECLDRLEPALWRYEEFDAKARARFRGEYEGWMRKV